MRVLFSIALLFVCGQGFAYSDDQIHPWGYQQVPDISTFLEYYSNHYQAHLQARYRCFHAEMPEASSLHHDRSVAVQLALQVSVMARCVRTVLFTESHSLYTQMYAPLERRSDQTVDEPTLQTWDRHWRDTWTQQAQKKCPPALDLALIGDGVRRQARSSIRCLQLR